MTATKVMAMNAARRLNHRGRRGTSANVPLTSHRNPTIDPKTAPTIGALYSLYTASSREWVAIGGVNSDAMIIPKNMHGRVGPHLKTSPATHSPARTTPIDNPTALTECDFP